MPTNNVIDLDARLGLNKDEPMHTKKVKLLGREWNVVCDVNTFGVSAIASGDLGAIYSFVRNLVIAEEADDFVAALQKARNMDGDKLFATVQALMEVAAERPTVRPSPSRATASKRTSSTRSQASSH